MPIKACKSPRIRVLAVGIILSGVLSLIAQPPSPSREYIRLGGRVIATETPSAQANITIASTGSITTIGSADTLQLTGTPNPSNAGTISWSASSGTVSSGGLYTPSSGITSDQTVQITAAIVNGPTSIPPFSLLVKPALVPTAANVTSSTQPTQSITLTKLGSWTAATSDAWLHITSSASGSGNATVTFTVDENFAGTSRQGTLTIAGTSFNVTQNAVGPSVAVSPPSVNVSGAGGVGNQQIQADVSGGATWKVDSTSSWIHVASPFQNAQSADGAFPFTADANPTSSPRTGQIVVSGTSVTVSQYGGITLNPTSQTVPGSGGTQTVQVIAPANSPWISASPPSGINITSNASGPGGVTTTMTYTVPANTGTSSRTLTWLIGGQNYSVTQVVAPALTINITGTGTVLASGIVTLSSFQNGASQSANWSLTPAIGTLSASSGSSIQYTAPSQISVSQSVTITASANGLSKQVSLFLSTSQGTILSPNSSGGLDKPWADFQLSMGPFNGVNGVNWSPMEILITNNSNLGNNFPSTLGSCYMTWDFSAVNSGAVLAALQNDAGSGFDASQLVFASQPNNSGTPPMQNHQCIIDVSHSSFQQVNTALVLSFRVYFNPEWSGAKQIYTRATAGQYSGLSGTYPTGTPTIVASQVGSWLVPVPASPALGFAGNTPADNAPLSSSPVSIQGYAFDSLLAIESSISSVEVFLDNIKIGNATLGDPAPSGSLTTCSTLPLIPNCPNIGFHFDWNMAAASNGAHVMSLIATDSSSTSRTTTIQRTFNVSNPLPQVSTPTFNPPGNPYGSQQTVTIGSATPGASIYYTTNGSTPTTSSTPYSDPIIVASSLTLKALAVKSGMTDSAIGSAAYTITGGGTVAAPTFSPTTGTYSSSQSVSISSATSGASIYYTTNGSTPTTASTLYSSPISVGSSLTLKALATKSGLTDSGVASSAYTINIGPGWYSTGGTWINRKAIVIDHTKIVGGSALTNFPVMLSVTDADLKTTGNGGGVGKSDGTDILLTAADGLTKLDHELASYTSSTGKVLIWARIPSLSASTDTTIYIYYGNSSASNQPNKTGVWDSNYAGVWHMDESSGTTLFDSTSYGNHSTKLSASEPNSNAAGQVAGAQTFDGYNDVASTPGDSELNTANFTMQFWVSPATDSSGLWRRLIDVPQSFTNHAMITTYNYPTPMFVYKVGTNDYQTGTNSAPPNQWSLVALTYNGTTSNMYVNGQLQSQSASSAALTQLNSTYITFGNRESQDRPSNAAMDEIRMLNSARSAGWIATEYNNQGSPSTFYALGTQQSGGSGGGAVAAPSFSPGAGTYGSTQSVTISTATSGAAIYYTVDGSTPTTSSTQYSSAISVAANLTLKAFAAKSGMTDSSVTSGAYVIQAQAASPTFSPAAGTYGSPQSVTVSSATSGATIYYTTNGSTPTTSSTVYSSAISVGSSMTLKALATKSGLADSGVGSAAYTINTGPSWYSTGGTWTHRKLITIDHTKIAGGGTLTNFPILFSEASDAGLAGSARSDGNDILFTSSDGTTKLDHEIEKFAVSTGAISSWIRIPSLAASTDTTIYIYYGNSSASNQQNKTGVWDSNYAGVWHMSESSGTTLFDSTSYGNHSTKLSASEPNSNAAGQVAGAQTFDGYNDVASTPGDSELNTANFTMQFWVSPATDSSGLWRRLIDVPQSFTNHAMITTYNYPTPMFVYKVGTNDYQTGTNSAPPNQWSLVALTYNGTTSNMYVNGQLQSQSASSAALTQLNSTYITFGNRESQDRPSNAAMDEIRMLNSARSAGWIATEYNNQGSPSTFYSLGGQQ